MFLFAKVIGIVALLFSPALAQYPNPIALKGSTGIHDPSQICKDSSGKHFIFGTGGGLSTKTSTDRITWTDVGSVFSSASWVLPYTGGVLDLWAPDCHFVNGQFVLYYTAATWGKRIAAVFVAYSKTGMPGSWTNGGLVISSDSTVNWQAIDPTLIIDGSKWYVAFGSYLNGIYLLNINPSTGLRSDSSLTHISQMSAGSSAEEASSLIKYGSYYYLFLSFNNCCAGVNSTYNVRVGRASGITGPYTDQAGKDMLNSGGTTILATHGGIYGPGGQSVYQDTDGWIIDYHYNTASGSFLGINHLTWSSAGWPTVTA